MHCATTPFGKFDDGFVLDRNAIALRIEVSVPANSANPLANFGIFRYVARLNVVAAHLFDSPSGTRLRVRRRKTKKPKATNGLRPELPENICESILIWLSLGLGRGDRRGGIHPGARLAT